VRALIVDDSRAMRTILRRLLIESGYAEVTEVAGVATARVAADEVQPDVVVVDWELPDGNALELVRELRDGGNRSAVVVLAPGVITEAGDLARAAGADECVSKPFTGDDLRRRLANAA